MYDVNKVVNSQIDAAFNRAIRAASLATALPQTIRNIQHSTRPKAEKLRALYVQLHQIAITLEQAKTIVVGAEAFAVVEENLPAVNQ